MVKYDPYTDSFIDNPTKETTATINLDAIPKNIIQLNVVEVSDESIEKIADAVVRKLADRKTSPNQSEKLTSSKEPQTNADQHVQRVEYVGNDERSRCWNCRHFERMHETPISSDGSYYTYVVCTAKECHYEPKDEPQTEREGE